MIIRQFLFSVEMPESAALSVILDQICRGVDMVQNSCQNRRHPSVSGCPICEALKTAKVSIYPSGDAPFIAKGA